MSEWNERKTVLMVVGFIFQVMEFDDNGLTKGAQEYMRCDLAAVYFGWKAENGEGESLMEPGVGCHTIFKPTSFECKVLGLKEVDAPNVVYYESFCEEGGMVHGRVVDFATVYQYRQKCNVREMQS